MKKILLASLVLVAAGALAACSYSTPSSGNYSAATSTRGGVPTSCHAGSYAGFPLPDPACTPGAVNLVVTPATESTTICKSGWTTTVRPPVSYTDALKRSGITKYGYSDHNLRDYEEDHLVPLEVGGSPTSPLNLWPEPIANAHLKDQVENAARSAVCSGKMPLAIAQQGFMTNWVLLGRVLGVPHL